MVLLSRLALIVVLGLAATATITYAAEQRLTVPKTTAPTTAPEPETLVVPNVVGQAYVFAKGILEDSGFGWRVSTGNGFAANDVTAQSPPAGTRVVDTGAPLIVLKLAKNAAYDQSGTADNASPFSATPVKLVGVKPAKSSAASQSK
jgi:beta-lactam-binding protein with PASTA domain